MLGERLINKRDWCNYVRKRVINIYWLLKQDISYTVGIEIDPSAIAIAQENCEEAEVEIDYINADVESTVFNPNFKFDTVIMNPPFGMLLVYRTTLT